MKKIIFGLFLIVILAIAGGTYYIFSNLDTLVKSAIEKHGSEVTKTAVSVGEVKIKLTDGSGSIKGLTIANPSGFDTVHAFSLGEITVGIDIKSLQQEPYIINEVTVRAPQIYLEVNSEKKTNLNELKNNLTGGGKPAKAINNESTAKSATSDNKAPRLIVRSLVFADGIIQVKVKPLNNKEYKLKLSSLKMKDLGGTSGVTPTELAKEIINRLITQAKKDVQEKGINVELNKLKAQVNKKLDEEKAKIDAMSDKKLQEEKRKLEEKLKGLFN